MNHTFGVLIVDDDWLIRKMVTVCLTQWPQYRLLGRRKMGPRRWPWPPPCSPTWC